MAIKTKIDFAGSDDTCIDFVNCVSETNKELRTQKADTLYQTNRPSHFSSLLAVYLHNRFIELDYLDELPISNDQAIDEAGEITAKFRDFLISNP